MEGNIVKDLNEGLVELCRSAIRIPSFSGQEKDMAEFMKQTMLDYGYDEVVVDRCGSVIGTIHGKKEGITILFDGHMDHVDVKDREQWTHDPFSAEIVRDRIYGRGSSDMKGGVTAMVTAVAQFANETKRDFCGTLCVSCSVHEECFEGIASREISSRVKPDFVIVCEPTSNAIKIGQRGRVELCVKAEGVSCHSSTPEKGVNAVRQMLGVIGELEHVKQYTHPILGKSMMELTDIISSPYPGASVLPFLCQATYDGRILVGQTKESVLADVQEAIDRAKEKNPGLKASCEISKGKALCWTGEAIEAERFFPAWVVSEEQPFVRRAIDGMKRSGIPFEIAHFDFCTNASHFCGEAGIPTIGYGPSYEALAHVRDEYIEIPQLLKASRGYHAMLEELTAKP